MISRPASCSLLRHSFRALALCLVALALMGAQGPAQPLILPDLGSDAALSLGEESRLGAQTAQQILRDPDWVDDTVIGDYLSGIEQPILEAARRLQLVDDDMAQIFAWRLMPIRSAQINAFSLPGGFFGVNLGLIALTHSRGELAAVLAHETAHVTQRHIARMISRAQRQTPLLLGALLLGIAAIGSGNVNAGAGAIIGAQAAGARDQLGFSRDAEREADRTGFALLRNAGFAPEEMEQMLTLLQQASRDNQSASSNQEVLAYLRTHPLTEERMTDAHLLTQSAKRSSGAAAGVTPGEDDHAFIAARAAALMNTNEEVQRHRRDAALALLAQPPAKKNARATLYGGALASLALRDSASAKKLLQALQTTARADDTEALLLALCQAEMALAEQRGQAALQALGPWLEGGVSAQSAAAQMFARSLTLTQARALLQLRRTTEAAQTLQLRAALHQDDIQTWEALAQAEEALKHRAAAQRARAQADLARYDTRAAQEKLRAATQLAAQEHDLAEASIISALTQQIRAAQARGPGQDEHGERGHR